MKKSRRYSWVCAVAAVLCSIATISIGFGIWTINDEGSNEPSIGSVGADIVDTNIRGIAITSQLSTFGHYFFEEKNGDDELVHSSTGNLIYTLSFDNVDTYYLINNTDMKLRFTLSYTNNLAIFDTLQNSYFDESLQALDSLSTDSVVVFEKRFNVVSQSTHTIKYKFDHMMVVKYASSMSGGSFRLRLEAIV